MDQSRKKSGDSHMWAMIKWLIVAVIVIVNLYADIKMYANGDLAYPLLDIILVGAGVVIFTNKRLYAHRYAFPNMAMLYMTAEKLGEVKNPAFVGAAVAGSVCGAYWFCMMIGRLLGGVIGGKVSSRVQITICSVMGIACMLAAMYMPVKMVTVFGKEFPLAMCAMALCGLFTSVMWGGIFNMAAEGLGKYVPMGSGIFMAMVPMFFCPWTCRPLCECSCCCQDSPACGVPRRSDR